MRAKPIEGGRFPVASVRSCRRCGAEDLRRCHLPVVLRPLRLLGVHLRAYRCWSCRKRYIRF